MEAEKPQATLRRYGHLRPWMRSIVFGFTGVAALAAAIWMLVGWVTPAFAHHPTYVAGATCDGYTATSTWIGGSGRRLILISEVSVNGAPYEAAWSNTNSDPAPNDSGDGGTPTGTNGVVSYDSYPGPKPSALGSADENFIWVGVDQGWTIFDRSGGPPAAGWGGKLTQHEWDGSSWVQGGGDPSQVSVTQPAFPTDCETPTPAPTPEPTPTPTPEPTPTAQPTPPPTSEPTPTPEPTPPPTPEPTATPTQEPTPTPNPCVTPGPEETPPPTPEGTPPPECVTPTPEPTPTDTPAPTPTQEPPTPSPSPTDQPTPSPTEEPTPPPTAEPTPPSATSTPTPSSTVAPQSPTAAPPTAVAGAVQGPQSLPATGSSDPPLAPHWRLLLILAGTVVTIAGGATVLTASHRNRR